MATGGVDERSRADCFRYTCSLCMEPYRGRQPKILPCFHTFCLPCLTTWVRSSACGGQQDGNEAEAESGREGTPEEGGQQGKGGSSDGQAGSPPKSFLCPTCRKPVTVPEGGVKNLQTNFYLDPDERDSTVSCDLCEEDRKEDATHACQECKLYLCQPCRKTHDKFSGALAHHVTPLGQCDPIRVTSPQSESKLCQSHPNQPLCLVCEKCDVTICLLCKLTSHEGHETVDMEAAAAQAKQDVEELSVRLKEQLSVLGSLLDRLDIDERRLARKKAEVTREVSARFEAAVMWLTQARDDVMSDLETRENAALREITSERMSARVAMENLQTAQSRVLGVACWGSDVVHVKSQLQDVLLDQTTIRQYAERAAEEDHVTSFSCHVAPGGLDKDVLRQYIGQIRDGRTDGAASAGPSMSVRELTDELTKLKAEITTLKGKTTDPVFFHVSLTGNSAPVDGKYTLIFNNVRYNAGNGYASGTGYFTAPVAGTYLFLASVGCQGYNFNLICYIQVNGSNVAMARGTQQAMGTCHVVVNLNAGDTVRVYGSNGCTYHSYDTWFSGVMISA